MKKGKKRNVLIIGAGGIGSFLIPLLDKTGLYDMTVYDPDIVEEKNLTYQNFSSVEVSMKKVEAMGKRYKLDAKPFPVLTANQIKGFDLVVCCADNLDIRRVMYNSDVKWLDLRAQGRNAAMISYQEDPKFYNAFTSGPDGSFSCQGNDWDGKAEGVKFMQVVIAGYGAQWMQNYFIGNYVEKHFRING